MDAKKLLTLVFISCFLLSSTIAQKYADIKISKTDNNNFFITLEVDKSNEISEIKVQGFSFAKGESNSFNIVYDSDQLKKHKGNKFEVHKLSTETDYALYTVTTYDKDGNRKQFPSQKINMPDGYSFSSKL